MEGRIVFLSHAHFQGVCSCLGGVAYPMHLQGLLLLGPRPPFLEVEGDEHVAHVNSEAFQADIHTHIIHVWYIYLHLP